MATYTPTPEALRLLNAARAAVFNLPPVATVRGRGRVRAVESALPGSAVGEWRVIFQKDLTDEQLHAFWRAWGGVRRPLHRAAPDRVRLPPAGDRSMGVGGACGMTTRPRLVRTRRPPDRPQIPAPTLAMVLPFVNDTRAALGMPAIDRLPMGRCDPRNVTDEFTNPLTAALGFRVLTEALYVPATMADLATYRVADALLRAWGNVRIAHMTEGPYRLAVGLPALLHDFSVAFWLGQYPALNETPHLRRTLPRRTGVRRGR